MFFLENRKKAKLEKARIDRKAGRGLIADWDPFMKEVFDFCNGGTDEGSDVESDTLPSVKVNN